MGAKRKKKSSGQGVNFAITIVTLSIIFVFMGYLIGQYAVKLLQEQHQTSLQQAHSGVAPVITSAQNPPPNPPGLSGSTSTSTPPSEPSPTPAATSTPATTPSTSLYRVQVGVFSERANADRMVALLKEAGYEGMIIAGPPHRVQTGAFSSQENAARLVDELKQKGFEAIIVR